MESACSSLASRPRAAAGGENGALWLLSLVDLMLLMLCSFVLLIVVARQDAEPAALAATRAPVPEAGLPAPARVGPDPRAQTHPHGGPVSQASMAPPATREETASELIRRYIQYDPSLAADRSSPRESSSAPADGSPGPADPSYTNIAASKFGMKPANQRPGSGGRNAEVFVRALRNIFAPADDDVGVDVRSGAITVLLPASISFRSASAELLPNVRPLLDQVALLLEKNPEVRVEASGHTDDRPIATPRYPSNWDLSVARAVEVARYLLSKAAIDPARMRVVGYADYAPIDPRTTATGRARNRRVEIRLEYGPWSGPRKGLGPIATLGNLSPG